VKVEFTRKSKDGRVTLVLDDDAVPVRSLWAVCDDSEPTLAKDSLRAREQTSAENIGSWIPGAPAPNQFLALPGWAAAHGLDAVIWTALRGKFHESDTRRPTCEEILGYLSSLTGNARDAAERYIRSAPTQIDTRYRREIEAALAWTPLSGSPGM
jgi:hypothetical protein